MQMTVMTETKNFIQEAYAATIKPIKLVPYCPSCQEEASIRWPAQVPDDPVGRCDWCGDELIEIAVYHTVEEK
tara:strand:+ start:495 stop:713 length:219 start_codon:yes stop_codon:yes gene_type:complete